MKKRDRESGCHSLRSKRFRKVFRTFALAPIFAWLKNEKCLERAENLTETLATQAMIAIALFLLFLLHSVVKTFCLLLSFYIL